MVLFVHIFMLCTEKIIKHVHLEIFILKSYTFNKYFTASIRVYNFIVNMWIAEQLDCLDILMLISLIFVLHSKSISFSIGTVSISKSWYILWCARMYVQCPVILYFGKVENFYVAVFLTLSLLRSSILDVRKSCLYCCAQVYSILLLLSN